jgi:hypothetical protein
MKRRNFIKTTAAGSAFLMTSGAFAFGNSVSQNNYKYGYQSERRIPVAYDVDVVIVGGTSAAVAAATAAAKKVHRFFWQHRTLIWVKIFAELTGFGLKMKKQPALSWAKKYSVQGYPRPCT